MQNPDNERRQYADKTVLTVEEVTKICALLLPLVLAGCGSDSIEAAGELLIGGIFALVCAVVIYAVIQQFE